MRSSSRSVRVAEQLPKRSERILASYPIFGMPAMVANYRIGGQSAGWRLCNSCPLGVDTH